ncbi:MAG: NUDIX domain-containing protein [Candidatus Wildermuthbacteria bacterium]|nr:NUDIX domain-containing protein [Candidatus Wildermuthbacteria bacterium]
MANKERFKLIPSVYAFFIQEEKILLLRRYQTGFEDGNYGLLAGHADGEETFTNALKREVSEEVGVQFDASNLSLALTMHRWCGDHERADFFFVVERWDGEPRNMEPNKCDDVSWFPLNQLPQNTIPYIRAAIDCYLKGMRYCEFGW